MTTTRGSTWIHGLLRWGSAAAALGCNSLEGPCLLPAAAPAEPVGSVLVVVMDDVGVDKVGAYETHPRPAPTPRLNAFAAGGVRFRSAYAEPLCSPSRAAILTGRRPIRTGIGMLVDREDGLSADELLLPEALQRAPGGPWATMAIGKWHLSPRDQDGPGAPQRLGFDHFDGILGNPSVALEPTDDTLDYWSWEHVVDGEVSWSNDYLPTAQANAAIDALERLPEPFFLYLAFSAAHAPIHVPPLELWSEADPSDDPGKGDAMIEALDHEIGRVLHAAAERAVTVIIVGDNGTTGRIVRPPADPRRAKHTVYTGGTHVPLLISGPGIRPGVSDALVHVTDLFSTVLDLAGMEPSDLGVVLDGTSVLPALTGSPVRHCLIVEAFTPIGVPTAHEHVSVLDEDFALVRHHDETELYRRDPLAPVEGPDLLAADLDRAAGDALRRMHNRLLHDLD